MNVPRRKRVSKLEQLLAFDRELLNRFCKTEECALTGILGVDEVGRGSLIGPVVAAALVFPSELPESFIEGIQDLDDSKAPHFSHEKRVLLAEKLKASCYWGIGEASQEEVESMNVAQASLLASYRAIHHLGEQFGTCCLAQHLVVIDGRLKIPKLPYFQTCEVKADGKSAAVAGASIIAKAYRDSMMIELSKQYPGYQWDTNAGYPTPAHQEAIAALGITPLHRKTYKVVREAMEQQTLLL